MQSQRAQPVVWPERWIDYLRSEREGARASVSRFGAFFVTLFVATLATFFALPRIPKISQGLVILTAFIYVWGFAVIVTSAYLWAQYLGTLKAISRRYLDPAESSWNQLERPEIRHADYWEVFCRDPGNLLRVVTNKQDDLDPKAEVERLPLPPNRARILFFGFLIGSAIATIIAPLAALQAIPEYLASLAYAISVILLAVLAFDLMRYVRSVRSRLGPSKSSP